MQIKNLIKLLIEYQEHISQLVAYQYSPERVQKIKKDIAATTNSINRQINDIQTARDKEAMLIALKQKKRTGASRGKSAHKQGMQNNQITNSAPSFDDFDEGVTPLMVACSLGLPNMAQMLIKAGASVNMATPEGKTAVTFAIENGHDDVVNFLLAQGASFRSNPAHYRYHPLVVAARENRDATLKVITRLMAQLPHVEDQFIYAHTVFALIKRPLMTQYEDMLRHYNNEDQYRELIDDRVKVVLDLLAYFLPKANRDVFLSMRLAKQVRVFENIDNQICSLVGMYSALALAAESADVAVVKYLLDFGFMPNEMLPGCVPPLVAATKNSDPAVAKCLVTAGADLRVQFQGESLIYWAMVDSNAHAMLKFLILEFGMLNQLSATQKHRAFDGAIKADNYAGCELFLEHGFDVNQGCSKSKSVILSSATVSLRGHFHKLELPLVSAIRKQNINIIALILRHTSRESVLAYIDKETGDSILMLAVKTGSAGIVRIVLQHCDDEELFHRRNHAGTNALQLAANLEQIHIFYVLWSWLCGVRGDSILMPVKLLHYIEDRLSLNLPAKLCMYLVAAGIQPEEIDTLRECIPHGEANSQNVLTTAIGEILASQSMPFVREELKKHQNDTLNQFYTTLLVECTSYLQTKDVGEFDKLAGFFEALFNLQQPLLAAPTILSCDLPVHFSSLRAYVMLAHLQHFFIFDKLHDQFMQLHNHIQDNINKLNHAKLIRLCEIILILQRNALQTFKHKQLFDPLVESMRESLLLRLNAYSKKIELIVNQADTLARHEKNKKIKAAQKLLTSAATPQPKAIALEKTQPILFLDAEPIAETSIGSIVTSKQATFFAESKEARSDSRGNGSNANKRSRQQEAARIEQERAKQLELIQQAAIQYQKNQAEQELQARQKLEKEQARKHLRELALQVNTVAKQISLNKQIRKKFNLLGFAAEQAYLVGSTAVKILKGAIKDNNADWDFLAAEFDRTYFVENNHIPGLFTYKGKNTTQNMHDKIDVILAPAACLQSSSSSVIDLAKECQRRDTTRKAVFIDVDGNVYDPTGYGLADIESNTIRVIIQIDYAAADQQEIQRAIEMRWLEDPKRLARWLKEMIEGEYPEFHLSEVLKRIDIQKISDPKQQDELFFKIKKLTEDLASDGLDKYNRVIAEFGLLEKLTWLRDQWKLRQLSRSPNANRLFAPTAHATGTEQPAATSTSIKPSM